MSTNADWVGEVLGAEPTPAMPDEVQARIVAALRDEVAHRNAGELAAEAKQAFDEVDRRSSLGSFSPNPPSHYDKPGLGMRELKDA
ncbi:MULTISPECIES: hypothetical protein [Aestuariimicrobium]|uniref:hypothetical protein n=1 Tax=Aestuariimicrobium TaxID=396388 RepID=UPI0003B41B9F|nr:MULTISPECIES: hypothetical protein [Aestuariimicrobium]CAI9403834.1 hypothetical protein AESSP_01084 [Aestuariimicrobium sp. T2.26MG-19.2B]